MAVALARVRVPLVYLGLVAGERAGVPHAAQPFSAPAPEPVTSALRRETLRRR